MIVIQQLAFERHYRFLFNHLESSLEAGEVLRVQGANGSGKSTLLRILAGFITPHSGIITWHGQSIFKDLNTYQQQLHYIGHQNGIKPYLTVSENLNLYAALTPNALTPHERHTVAVKLGLKRFLHTQTSLLSAGLCRRLSLARLLLSHRPLWILDEPTTTLDVEGQHLFSDLIATHLSQGNQVILATHQSLDLTHPLKTIHLGEKPQ